MDTKQTAAVAVIYMSERMRGNQAVKTGATRDWLIIQWRHVRCPNLLIYLAASLIH